MRADRAIGFVLHTILIDTIGLGIIIPVAPVVGNLSDRFGRRPVPLLAPTGFGINYLIMGLAPTI